MRDVLDVPEVVPVALPAQPVEVELVDARVVIEPALDVDRGDRLRAQGADELAVAGGHRGLARFVEAFACRRHVKLAPVDLRAIGVREAKRWATAAARDLEQVARPVR